MFKKKKKGVTLIELIGVMIIIAILLGIGGAAVSYGMQKSRETSVQSALKSYESAFSSIIMDRPGIQSTTFDAIEAITADGAGAITYSSKEVHKETVALMNTILEPELQLAWNDTAGWYESVGNDPYGGKYIFTEVPVDLSTEPSYDPDTFDISAYVWDYSKVEYKTADNAPVYTFVIASTGRTDSIDSRRVISEKDAAMKVSLTGGVLSTEVSGLGKYIFSDTMYIPMLS